jgi:hypothetical protein
MQRDSSLTEMNHSKWITNSVVANNLTLYGHPGVVHAGWLFVNRLALLALSALCAVRPGASSWVVHTIEMIRTVH